MAANDGRYGPESDHAAEFRLIADGAISGVITVLLAAAGVDTDGLEVAIRRGADGHFGPGGRNDEGANARELFGIVQRHTGRFEIAEGIAAADAADAGSAAAHIAQACFGCRFQGIGRKHGE